MKRLNWLFISVNILFIVMPGGCNRIPTLPDNCTCDTGHGIYSLFPLRSTHGPKFSESGFLPHPGYTYDYNPCVPFTKTSPEGKCINVALCKYNKGDQPVYSDIGEQRKVQCEISDGKISLIYPVHNNNISTHESKVILKCSNNSLADSQFTLTDEDSMTFTLSSICGCPNQCLPVTTKGGPLSTKPNTTPSSGPEDKGLHLNWKLVILLPSLAGFLVLVIFFVCLWRRLSVIQEALLCRCCHCCEYRDIRDPVREEGIVSATETSSLINNQMNSRAVEHEDSVAKDKVKEPVQVEDGDVEEDCKFPGKGDRTVVV